MLCIAGVSLSKLKDSDTAKQMQKRANVCLGAQWLHWGYGKEVECGRDKVIYCIGSSDSNDTHAAVVVAGVVVQHMLHETLNTAQHRVVPKQLLGLSDYRTVEMYLHERTSRERL